MGVRPRIAIVQHGDYREASAIISSGQREPYFGMEYSLRVIGELLEGCEYILFSLNAPGYNEQHGQGRWIGLPRPRVPNPLPQRWGEVWRARLIAKAIRKFKATHLLLRSGGELARMVLERLEPLRINTLVICANMFSAEDQRSRKHMKRLITQLNRKHVYRVGNHRWPATDSMTKYGLNPDKAIAWDWPGARHPQDFPVKTLDTSRPAKVFYVGTLSKAKGVCEVLEAIRILRSKGCQAQLQIAGDGPERQWLLDRATAIEGIELLGQVSNDEVFDTMRESTLVCVPSRHEFSEGMPLSLTEALASRTPVVASDHPVLRSSLRDGEGAVIFRAGEAVSLAEAIGRVLTDASFYASLSASTLHAYQRLQCPTSFGDLVEDWQRSWRRDLQAQC